jgi:hypothetical protein
MINGFEQILRKIYLHIPEGILDVAFEPNKWKVTLDQRIMDTVIEAYVLPDCNIYAGATKRIYLSQCIMEPTSPVPGISGVITSNMSAVYRIPPAVREHRNITAVTDLSYPFAYSRMSDPTDFNDRGNNLYNLAQAAIDSRTLANEVITPTPVLQTGNVIKLTPMTNFSVDWVMTCRLEYDKEFTNLHHDAVAPLADLGLCMTKCYIYTKLILKINEAELSGGQELGKFKDIIEDYKQEFDRYKDLIDEFRGGAFLDPDTIERIMLMSI